LLGFPLPEFPNLRTTASPSGDRGADAVLFSPLGDPTVVLQYSIRGDWPSKIAQTVTRINTEFPQATTLIYLSNQRIGSAADELKTKLRSEKRLALDIRDRSWFLDRINTNPQREIAAEALAKSIVDPLLESRRILESKAPALTALETRAAFLYLALQWNDDTREKGLTKLCFDALVRAALSLTDSDNRLTREEVRDSNRKVLSSHPAEKVDQYTTPH
jgi:hypothetical protein